MGGEARVSRDSCAKRWLIWPALILAVLGVLAAALLFTWPQDSAGRTRFDVGPVDTFAVGSVTTVEEGKFHLVRWNDETFIALSSTDSHLRKCVVNWESDLAWPPRSIDASQGWFRAYCSGSVFDRLGHRVFGPSPRDLDRFVVLVAGGAVFVDTSNYVCGYAPPGAGCFPSSSQP